MEPRDEEMTWLQRHEAHSPARSDGVNGVKDGGPQEDRTPDLCLAKAALSQLS